MTKSQRMRLSVVMISSTMPSARRPLPGGAEIDVFPKCHRLRLLRSTRRAPGAAEALHLVVVACPLRARQCRRRAGAELVGAFEHPWLRARMLLPQRQRRRDVGPRGGVRPVGVGGAGAVGSAIGLDRLGHLLPRVMPSDLAGPSGI